MAPNVIGSILCNLILTYSSLRSSPIPTTPSVVPCECSFGKLRSAHAQLRALTSQRGNKRTVAIIMCARHIMRV